MRVLILEDNLAAIKLYQFLLQEHKDVEALYAKNVGEALELLKKYRFDAQILDFFVPDGDAIDVWEKNTDCPTMVMTHSESVKEKYKDMFVIGDKARPGRTEVAGSLGRFLDSVREGTYRNGAALEAAMAAREEIPDEVREMWNEAAKVQDVPGTDVVSLEYARVGKEISPIFNALDIVMYICDMETYELLYVNEYTKKLFGKDITGELCHKALQDLEEPCDFCTNEIIKKTGAHRWKYHNKKPGRTYAIVDKVIEWNGHGRARLETAIDITEFMEGGNA